MKISLKRICIPLVASTLLVKCLAADPDQHENCAQWAEVGECDKNPGFMLTKCASSCEAIEQQALEDAEALAGIDSFFDLSAPDIHGNIVSFSDFKDQVTIVVNVASYCGYTDGHYTQLVQLWSQLKSSGNVNILAFPCNQFGQQEPESNDKIYDFALGYGVDFKMMSKIDVNGANADIVYKYLKGTAGPSSIGWNFATYYVIGPDGSVESHSGIEPLQLKEVALSKLSGDEL